MSTSFDRDWRRIKEQVEILAGERGATGRPERAVRLREIAGISAGSGNSITKVSQLENDKGYVNAAGAAAAAPIQDVIEGVGISIDDSDPKRPVISANYSGLAAVAFSGSYDDLEDKPPIPPEQVNSDWNAASGVSAILNKPTLGSAAAADLGGPSGAAPLGADSKVPNEYLPSFVPSSRTISTSAPLSGGGSMSSNRTISINTATPSSAGSMSGEDKSKLDGIASGATVGASWGSNLYGIPANISGWSGISPTSKWDRSSAAYAGLDGATSNRITDVTELLPGARSAIFSAANTATGLPIAMAGAGVHVQYSANLSFEMYLCNTSSPRLFVGTHPLGNWEEAWTTGNLKGIVGTEISFGPESDNASTCGSASSRWSVIHAGTGTISTSDARDKTPVRPLTPAELAASIELGSEIGAYQWLEMIAKKGKAARQHIGLTVQRAIAIMESHGLDPFAYGFICYDQWDELPEIRDEWPALPQVVDDFGNLVQEAREAGYEIVQEHRPAGDRYSFRMDELLAFIASGERAARLRLEERISAIEAALGLTGNSDGAQA